MAKNYKMFETIVLANTGYSENKKLYTIDCSKLDKGDLDYEYTKTINDKIDIPFELIGMKGQQIKPVFDCDPKFNKNDEVDVLKTIQSTIVELDKMYPNKEKNAIMRIRDVDDTTKKISYHITVDGIRTNIETIKHKLKSFGYEKDKPFDYSIYSHNRGLHSCFTNKKKDQKSNGVINVETFMPICLETGNILQWKDIDIRKYSPSYIEESFETDFMEPPKGPIDRNIIIEPRGEKQYDNRPNLLNSIIKVGEDNIKDLLSCLSHSRVEDYEDWLKIGMILKNIDDDNFDKWCEWSSIYHKFDIKECQNKWDSFKRGGLSIASLKYFAKLDNPKKYKEITYNSVIEYINKSVASSGSHLDVAYLCSHILKDLVIYDNTTKFWFMIDETTNIWQKDEKGTKLSIQVGVLLSDLFAQHCNYLTVKAMQKETMDEKQVLMNMVEETCKVSNKVKNNTYRKSILTDLQGLLCDDDIFENKLDTKIHLFAFNNGVLDLDNEIFRKIEYSDYIHTTTGYDYDMKIDQKYIDEINQFLTDIQDKDDLRSYLIDILSCRLYGKNIHQEFYINTGTGANGKSVLFNLIQTTFGKYSVKMRSEVFTKPSRGANETSGLAHTRNSRIIQVEEPENNDKLIVSRLKEMSGDSSIEVRGLYQTNLTQFTPKFGMIFYCNEIPGLSKADKATGRRLRIIPFNNKFVDDPKLPFEKKKDKSLNIKFKNDVGYTQAFIKILFDNWVVKDLMNNLETPEPVLEASKTYMEESDVVKLFIDENYEIDETPEEKMRVKLSATDLFNHFKRLNKDVQMDKKGFSYSLDQLFGKEIKKRYNTGMKYFLKLKELEDGYESPDPCKKSSKLK